jgi:type VI secretion system protein ImpL
MWWKCNQSDDLTSRCKEAINFLKKTSVTKNNTLRLHNLPAYLLIGPSRSGKTTLLSQSNLKFFFENKIDQAEKIESTSNYDWWMTSKAIIIDTPGIYFASSQNKRKDRYLPFLKTLQKLHYKKHIQGILVTLSITDIICQDNYIKLFYENVQQQLAHILSILGWHIPTFLIINKCDLISGFQEFFSDLSREERWQMWGFPLTHQDTSTKFDKEFDRLIHRLNSQIISKLQYEKMLDKRILINNFPFQMSQLKPYLQNFIEHIFDDMPSIRLKGLFLTSGAQQQPTIEHKKDETKSSESKSNALTITIKPFYSRAFFIHDLLDGFILSGITRSYEKLSSTVLLRPVTYSIAGLLIFLCAIGLSVDFNHQIKTINTAQKAMALYQVFNNTDCAKADLAARLESLNALSLATKMLTDEQHLKFSLLMPNNRSVMAQLRKNISLTYYHALQTLLLPKIVDQFTDILTDKTTKPNLLYKALKSYLMITDTTQFKPNDVIAAVQEFWKIKYPKETQLKLTEHFSELLSNSPPSVQINQQAIKKARNRLIKLQSIERAYVILGDAINNQPLSLNLHTNKIAASVFTFVETNPVVPSMYTAKYFANIYPRLIKKASKEAITGNWIIGEVKTDKTKTSQQINHLTAKMSEHYLQDYAKTWLNFLNNIQMIHFTQLDHMTNTLKVLGTPNSPLTQLIELIQSNLVPEVIRLDDRLQSFKELSSLKNITYTLNDLYVYLSPLDTTKNLDQKTFKLTSIRMRNMGQDDALSHLFSQVQRYPEPIKNWLYDICVNAWQLMLYQTQSYIDHLWEKDIVPQYQAQLENRFPFSKTSSTEASLESFTYFFAPNSLIDNFFNSYLSPFINSAKRPWAPKNLDGDALPLAHETIAFFQKAYDIQHIYFPNMSRKPLVSFTIKPIYLEGNLNQVNIALGSQQMNYQYGQPFATEEFVWPDYIDSNLMQVIFTDKNNSQIILDDQGPWALLKLLQQSGLHFTKEPSQYAAQFSKGDYSMIVNIETKLQENPFLLERFAELSFPTEL